MIKKVMVHSNPPKLHIKRKIIEIIISDTGSMEKQQTKTTRLKLFQQESNPCLSSWKILEKKNYLFYVAFFCGKITFQSSRMIYLVLITVTDRHLMSTLKSIIFWCHFIPRSCTFSSGEIDLESLSAFVPDRNCNKSNANINYAKLT